mmetsp:Transcript_44944/g.82091  ORF Transcript_44944/g.82091 Transcript_44944/m.82091 type:complete len:293 (+) Transcript_44944:69-947(+)
MSAEPWGEPGEAHEGVDAKPEPEVIGRGLDAQPKGHPSTPEGESTSDKVAQEVKDIRKARCVSVVSLLASAILGAMGLSIGIMEESLSLVGFGGEAILDGISSALVLWRFKTPKARNFIDEEAAHAAKEARDRLRERNSGIGIGGIFMFTAGALLFSAVIKVMSFDPEKHEEEEREATLWGHILAWPSVVIFGTLAVVKHRLSKALHSQVLAKDALCSLLGAGLSLIVACAALIEQVANGNPQAIMVVDVVAGAGIALILFVEGARMLAHNLSSAALADTRKESTGLTNASI